MVISCRLFCSAFRALLQIQALQPLDPDELIDDDEMTGNPKVCDSGLYSTHNDTHTIVCTQLHMLIQHVYSCEGGVVIKK